MNNRLVIQHLWWKELRQLVPMLVFLPTIATLLTIIILATSETNRFYWSAGVVIFLGMPGLFAVGAGALLVGQEKELRTIEWLTSLPIRPATIVRIKTATAVFGLFILWIICGLYFLWQNRPESPGPDDEHFWVWPANSLFILFAGLALAWKSKSSLVALLLVVPIAAVPYVLAVIVHQIVFHENRFGKDPSAVTVVTVQLICSAIALFLVDRVGRRALLPQRVHSARSYLRFASQGDQRGEALTTSYGVTQSPFPALIWQFARQSRALLVGTSLMLAFASVVLVPYDQTQRDTAVSLAMLMSYLAVSWLGVSVFQSDSVHQRIRFLADRGVSPTLVWLTRQAVPAAVITTILIGTFLFAVLVEPRGLRSSGSLGAIVMLPVALMFVIYSFSQWVGQVITSPIVSMIAAPLISMVPFAFNAYTVSMLDAPLMLVPIATCLPLVATFLLTRRWMDRRFGPRYWFMQAGFAAAIFLIPVMPHIAALVQEPGMSRQVQAQLNAVARSSHAFRRTPIELVLNRDTREQRRFESFVQVWNDQLESAELQLSRTSAPIGYSSSRLIQQVYAINLLLGMSIEQNDKDIDQEKLNAYRRSFSMLSDFVVRMRESPQIVDQDFADLIEIALLRQMRRRGVRVLLGEERYWLIAKRLADKSARREARIRAVALSWVEYEKRTRSSGYAPYDFGGYELQGGGDGWDVRSGKTLMDRRVSRRAQNLWDLAKFDGDEVPRERLLRIANDWGRSPAEYGLGSIANHYRVDDADVTLGSNLTVSKAVASQWYAGWEVQASELLNVSD